MKQIILIILFIFTCAQCWSQVNLVLNPSLEQYSHCPDNYDEIKYANYWMQLDTIWSPPDWSHDPAGVPEYYNKCSGTTGLVGVPSNIHFYHYPRTNNGMASVQMFYDHDSITNAREYLQGHLITTLVSGQSYCVTFYVTSEQASSYAINKIGAYFDNGTIDTTHNYGRIQSQYTPQIIDTSIINDTLHWVKIQGSFIANGTERLITIGNFSPNHLLSCIAVVDTTGGYLGSGGVSWYLVDDISVIASTASPNAGPDQTIPIGGLDSVTIGDTTDTYLPVTWYVNGIAIDSNTASLKVKPDTTTTYIEALFMCGGEVKYDTVTVYVGTLGNVANVTNVGRVKIFPNPATNEINVINGVRAAYIIFDITGRQVAEGNFISQSQVVDISMLQSGVYLLQITDLVGRGKVVKRVVKE